jgi:SAM-dependent methyltransferase
VKSLSQKTQELYNKIAVDYNNAFPFHFHPELLQLFVSHLKSRARILDVGCAGGRDTNYFNSLGFNVTGVDFSKSEIEYARSKYPSVNFLEADLLNLLDYFPAQHFDGIYCYATLDHLEKKYFDKAIAVFSKLLNKGGILYIVTRKGKGIYWTNDLYSQGLKRRFTLIECEELTNLLEKNHFSILKCDEFESLTRKGMFFYSVLASKK